MRIAVPDFGPVAIAALRVAGASLLLVPLLAARGDLGVLRRHWRPIAVLGVTNSAVPFFGFAYAAITTRHRRAGDLQLGGAAVRRGRRPALARRPDDAGTRRRPGDRLCRDRLDHRLQGRAARRRARRWRSSPASLATVCYGVSPSVTKRYLSGVPPLAVAAGSQLVGAALLVIPAVFAWPATPPSLSAWLVVAALSFVCTGLALLMYFRLIAHAGPANAISVTYLIPVFAIAWGSLFLDEAITWPLLAGCAVVFLGTALATGILRPRIP